MFDKLPIEKGKHTILSFPNKMDGISYTACPTMDLVALTSENGRSISIYRKTGHKVWEAKLPDGIIKSVVWKPDGKQIALINSKNQCLIYDSNTSQILSTLSGSKDEDFSVGGWYVTEITKGSKFKGTLDSDVMKSLPRLPPLPSQSQFGSASAPQHKFATKQALETMIHNLSDDKLDLLFLFSDSKVNIVLLGLFSLGPVDLIPNNHEDEEIVNYITANTQDHYIVTSSFTTMKYKIRRFQTQFIDNYEFLQEIATSSSKIIALQGYIDEVATYCSQEIKNYLDFNNRFIGILKSELEDKDTTASDELYNLLLTGMMEDDVKDWLENTIGERGVKRWIKASELSFDGTRRTMIYHLVPTCERIILLLDKLGGSAKASSMINEEFTLSHFLESKESVKDLLKLIFESIRKINKEKSLFNAFIKWIQVCLSNLQDEKPKEEYKTSEVSEFLNTYFEKSGLLFLNPILRRCINTIKISTNELFNSVKENIKRSIVVDKEFSLEVGTVTESQLLSQTADCLQVLTHQENFIDIHRIHLPTLAISNTRIINDNNIQDMKVSQDYLYMLSNLSLSKIHLSDLNNIAGSGQITINDLNYKVEVFENLEETNGDEFKPTYLTLNENFLCLISDNKEGYLILGNERE